MNKNGTFSKSFFSESRALFFMALPLVAAQVGQTLIGVVDAIMAGRVSSADLAAVSVGASIWFPLTILVLCTLMAVTPFVARYYGSGKYDKIAPVAYQGLILSVILGILCFFMVRNAGVVFNMMGIEPGLAKLTQSYLEAVSWGIPAFAGYQVFRSVSEGLGKMWPVTFVSFLSLAVNVPLNYIFIYGKLGFPAMGGVGCGWASAASMWAMFLAMGWIVYFSNGYDKADMKIRIVKPDFHMLKDIFKIGFPIGLSVFAEAGIFSIIALFVARFGSEVVSGHQIALSFAGLIFMIPLGISMAVTVRVGHALGRGRGGEARFSAFTGVGVTFLFAIFSCTMYVTIPEYISMLYTNIPEVIAVATGLFLYAGLFQFSDSVQVCASGALRGYKDTAVPMVILVINYWFVCIPFGIWLGIYKNMGVRGFWLSLVLGLTLAATALFIRLYVISKRHLDDARPE